MKTLLLSATVIAIFSSSAYASQGQQPEDQYVVEELGVAAESKGCESARAQRNDDEMANEVSIICDSLSIGGGTVTPSRPGGTFSGTHDAEIQGSGSAMGQSLGEANVGVSGDVAVP